MRGYQSGTNPDVAIIIPSTGRAEQCTRLVERIHETARTGPAIMISVEYDDFDKYADALARVTTPGQLRTTASLIGPPVSERGKGSHVAAINRAALSLLPLAGAYGNDDPMGSAGDPKLIIKLDDDHWPVTPGWDQLYLNALDELGGTGVVYGNDLLQGEALPTVPGLSADIVRELGWYAPPQLGHLFCDNYWLELGRRSGRLSYMPHVLIEHRHPAASKAKDDATYAAGGQSPLRWSEDEREWRKIINTPIEETGRTFFANPTRMDLWAESVTMLAERGSSR